MKRMGNTSRGRAFLRAVAFIAKEDENELETAKILKYASVELISETLEIPKSLIVLAIIQKRREISEKSNNPKKVEK